MKGHFEKAGLPPCRVLREFRVDEAAAIQVGDKVQVDVFAPGDVVYIPQKKGLVVYWSTESYGKFFYVTYPHWR